MCVPWELNPQPFALLTQCSTTEPQEHLDYTRLMWSKSAVYKVQEQQEKPDPLISYVIVYTCYPSIPHRTGTRSYVDLSSIVSS